MMRNKNNLFDGSQNTEDGTGEFKGKLVATVTATQPED